jgi:thiol:disulfide interchange protein DsbC
MQDTHCTPADSLPAAAPSGLPARRRGHLVRLGQALAIASCLAGTAQADTGAAAAWQGLPLEQAIRIVHGKGERALALFTDPDCPYCRKLETATLSRIDNVTIYVFLFPLDQHADAGRKSHLIWCAPDRAAAWNDWMRSGRLPPPAVCAAPPLSANRALGARLGITATPTIVLPDGRKIPGAVDAAALERALGRQP